MYTYTFYHPEKNGVTAVFGPTAPMVSVHCMNVCDAKDIPYVDFRWDADTRAPVINMQPHPDALAALLVDLISAFGWDGFTIIYETGKQLYRTCSSFQENIFCIAPWLPRVAELLKLYDPKEYTVTVRRLISGLTDNNYRAVLRRVKLSEDLHIIIDCSTDALPEVLKQVACKTELVVTNN